MLFDLHVHQDKHSLDSKLNIVSAINDAKSLGLSGLCITDHDDLGLREEASRLSKEHGITLIVGVEIFTLDGDLLCYGIDEIPNERLSAQETINFVKERGGVCIAAHPYRNNNRGIADKLYDLYDLDGVEGYNGRTNLEENLKAVKAAKDLNIPITGGSDAHSIGEVGNYVTKFDETIQSELDFINAIKSRHFKAVNIKRITSSKERTA